MANNETNSKAQGPSDITMAPTSDQNTSNNDKTIPSDGTVDQAPSAPSSSTVVQDTSNDENPLVNMTEDEIAEAGKAASRIQAQWRGHQTRKQIDLTKPDQTSDNINTETVPSTATQPHEPLAGANPGASTDGNRNTGTEEENPLLNMTQDEIEEAAKAATRIQAQWRGHQTRKQVDVNRSDDNAQSNNESNAGNLNPGEVHIPVDLEDEKEEQEQRAAALSAQSHWHGAFTQAQEEEEESEGPEKEENIKDQEQHVQAQESQQQPAQEQQQGPQDDIDLVDAARLIQSQWRGYQTRKTQADSAAKPSAEKVPEQGPAVPEPTPSVIECQTFAQVFIISFL
jgi:hypothetical protein